MKLVIISHTEHYKNANGNIVGWSPTVNEINHLAPHFKSITHIAMLHNNDAPNSSMSYSQPNINFVALPVLGGKGLWNKLKIVFNVPKVLKIVRHQLKEADAFQLRTPTGIAVFLIPYLTLFSKKKGWYKYAGNWNQKKPPLGYRLQRWMLKKQSKIVTINGVWQNQLKHCLTFENPCLTDKDLVLGKEVIATRKIEDKIDFCYVGRLETPKGVGRIIEAFKNLSEVQKNRVGAVHLVGDGKEKSQFQSMSQNSGINFKFYGYLNRDAVFEIYKKSHFFLMPTMASEGFPKVIAEASNFGCVPIVSDVSAITQYIVHQKNGFVLADASSKSLQKQLKAIFDLNLELYKKMNSNTTDVVKRFTFQHYRKRILNEILKDH